MQTWAWAMKETIWEVHMVQTTVNLIYMIQSDTSLDSILQKMLQLAR